MNESICQAEIAGSTLLAYWLGELEPADSNATEEHVFGCVHCSHRLQRLAGLGTAIRQSLRAGNLLAVLSASFVGKLKQDGLRVREYHVQPGTSVACTVAPDDDLVVSRLHASLAGVQRLDLEYEDLGSDMRMRLQDLAFDPAANEIVLTPNTAHLRRFDATTFRMRLLAVQDGADRELGIYTFRHSPHGA